MNCGENAEKCQQGDYYQRDTTDDQDDPKVIRNLQIKAERFSDNAESQGMGHTRWQSLICRPKVQVLNYHSCISSIARKIDSLRCAIAFQSLTISVLCFIKLHCESLLLDFIVWEEVFSESLLLRFSLGAF